MVTTLATKRKISIIQTNLKMIMVFSKFIVVGRNDENEKTEFL